MIDNGLTIGLTIDNLPHAELVAEFRGLSLTSAGFFLFFYFFLKDICFVKQVQYTTHERHMRSNHGNAILQMPASELPGWSSRRPAPLSLALLTFDVRQYSSEHKWVMFSDVKAAICGGDLGFDRASSPDFGLSGFSSVFQLLTLSVKVGSIKFDAKLSKSIAEIYFLFQFHLGQYFTSSLSS